MGKSLARDQHVVRSDRLTSRLEVCAKAAEFCGCGTIEVEQRDLARNDVNASVVLGRALALVGTEAQLSEDDRAERKVGRIGASNPRRYAGMLLVELVNPDVGVQEVLHLRTGPASAGAGSSG